MMEEMMARQGVKMGGPTPGGGDRYARDPQNGEVYVTPHRDAWERWVLTTDDAVRLRSAQWGLNLGSRPDGSIYTHTNRAQWERWWGTIV